MWHYESGEREVGYQVLELTKRWGSDVLYITLVAGQSSIWVGGVPDYGAADGEAAELFENYRGSLFCCC